jgi:hypothetical protein
MKASIPNPMQIVIDDVGWWSGEDGHERAEPFRTGIGRNHVAADYAAIISLGRKLSMRPQAAMILCEWDRTNMLRELPSSTWMGKDWDNGRWAGPWLDEAAAILRDGVAHAEVALHGIGHEYWIDGNLSRAEWFSEEGVMRPRDQVEAHLEFYARLMEQNGLGPFPESYVPCAFKHRFGDEELSFIDMLKAVGVRYMSTPFSCMHSHHEPEYEEFGVDCGMLNVNRGHTGVEWTHSGPPPSAIDFDGTIVGLHWPNILHADPARNEEVVDAWVQLLQPFDHEIDRTLSPDTAHCWTQLAYHVCVDVDAEYDAIDLNFERVATLSAEYLIESFLLKIDAPAGAEFMGENVEILSEAYDEVGKHHILELQPEAGETEARIVREDVG